MGSLFPMGDRAAMNKLKDLLDALLKRLSPYFVTSALLIYAMMVKLVFPTLQVVGNEFAADVANPAAVPDPVLRTTATGVLYVVFIGLAIIIGVIVIGSILVGIWLVVYEVVRIFVQTWRALRRTTRTPRAPRRRVTSTSRIRTRTPRRRGKIVQLPDRTA